MGPNVRQAIFDLFEKDGDGTWWRDGIFSNQAWRMATWRIVFILKEPNGQGKEIRPTDPPSYLVSGSYAAEATSQEIGWRELGPWAHSILESCRGRTPSYEVAFLSNGEHEKLWMNDMYSSAVMNLKKVPGSGQSNMSIVREWARSNSLFLLQQFDLLDPDIVVFCGESVREISMPIFFKEGRLSWPQRQYALFDGKLCIDFCHYNVRGIDSPLLYYALSGLMRQALTHSETKVVLEKSTG